MSSWFCVSVLGLIGILPLYFLSLEHARLDEKYGEGRGRRLGEVYGRISGWAFFLCWLGIWISPQPRFTIPMFEKSFSLPIVDFSVPILHLIISLPFIVAAIWFGIVGVQGTGLETAETHRAGKVVTTGIYSIVRHPQYLGGLLAHIGFSFLFSAMYSLVAFPAIVVAVYLISRKEEKELVKEFGKEYENYMNEVPMLMPRFKRVKRTSNHNGSRRVM